MLNEDSHPKILLDMRPVCLQSALGNTVTIQNPVGFLSKIRVIDFGQLYQFRGIVYHCICVVYVNKDLKWKLLSKNNVRFAPRLPVIRVMPIRHGRPARENRPS